jgi:hypothetical protein
MDPSGLISVKMVDVSKAKSNLGGAMDYLFSFMLDVDIFADDPKVEYVTQRVQIEGEGKKYNEDTMKCETINWKFDYYEYFKMSKGHFSGPDQYIWFRDKNGTWEKKTPLDEKKGLRDSQSTEKTQLCSGSEKRTLSLFKTDKPLVAQQSPDPGSFGYIFVNGSRFADPNYQFTGPSLHPWGVIPGVEKLKADKVYTLDYKFKSPCCCDGSIDNDTTMKMFVDDLVVKGIP